MPSRSPRKILLFIRRRGGGMQTNSFEIGFICAALGGVAMATAVLPSSLDDFTRSLKYSDTPKAKMRDFAPPAHSCYPLIILNICKRSFRMIWNQVFLFYSPPLPLLPIVLARYFRSGHSQVDFHLALVYYIYSFHEKYPRLMTKKKRKIKTWKCPSDLAVKAELVIFYCSQVPRC